MNGSRDRKAQGTVLQLQGFSTHDGDGIRTTVFLMGCPLRCRWCANPETWTALPKRAFYRHKCTGCGACMSACPRGLDPRRGTDAACRGCDTCVGACPSRALARLGRVMTVEEVAARVARDEVFYRYSGGGVTFSGGEPTAQPGFLRALAERLDSMGIDLWMETCGFFDYEGVRDILARLSHIFFDLKLMDEGEHMRYTGQSNKTILKNVEMVYNEGIPLTVRLPCIPGVTLTRENVEATADFIRQRLPQAELELLPYHRLGEEKYPAIGLDTQLCAFEPPPAGQMRQAEEWLRARGVRVVSYL